MSKLDILRMLYPQVTPLEQGVCILGCQGSVQLYDWQNNRPVSSAACQRIRPVEGTPFVLLESLLSGGGVSTALFHLGRREVTGTVSGRLLPGDKLPRLTVFRRIGVREEDMWFVCDNDSGEVRLSFAGKSLGRADAPGCQYRFAGSVQGGPEQLWYLTDDCRLKSAAQVRGNG